MIPLRYQFLSFGGSWAQRQVFNVTMIQAAIKANNLSVALGLAAEMMVHWSIMSLVLISTPEE